MARTKKNSPGYEEGGHVLKVVDGYQASSKEKQSRVARFSAKKQRIGYDLN
jgi:hypothetical protein